MIKNYYSQLLVIISFLFPLATYPIESSNSFVINAMPRFYKVLSPVKIDNKIGLLIENKTLEVIRGKLYSKDYGDIKHISIKSFETFSFEFEYDRKQKYYFLPLSPPFQQVELKIGEKSYEVPTQR